MPIKEINPDAAIIFSDILVVLQAMDIKVEMNRQVRNQEIKGTPPVQVKGRKFSGVY